jgi:hypothetical protein
MSLLVAEIAFVVSHEQMDIIKEQGVNGPQWEEAKSRKVWTVMLISDIGPR